MGTLKGRSIKHLMVRRVTSKDKICIKTSNDSKNCSISGMTLLSPNFLIITDYDNMAVKIFGISRMSVLDQYYLDSKLYDVSSVSHDKIAVTIPYKQAIQLMSVSGNNLKKKKAVKVDGECRGISCQKDLMVVTFTSPAKVKILHINGIVLRTIQDENILSWPWYATTSDNHIYVSDHGNNTLFKLYWQGEVNGKCLCRKGSFDLTMSDDDTVFVCCCYDNAIWEISEYITREQNVVEDTKSSNCLLVC